MKRRAFVGKYANAQDPFDYAAQLCLRRSAQGDRVSFYVILRSRGIAARIEGSLKTKPSSILHFKFYILHLKEPHSTARWHRSYSRQIAA